MVSCSEVAHFSSPGNRYGDLNQDYAVSLPLGLKLDRICSYCPSLLGCSSIVVLPSP